MKTNLPFNQLPIWFSLVLTVFATSGYSQTQVNNLAFSAGETVNYDVYYNWGFIWMHAAQVSFSVEDTKWKNKQALHLVSHGSTLPGYDWFFKVRDKYEAIVDPNTLSPFWFHCDTREGDHFSLETYHFYPEKLKAVTQTANSEKPFSIDTLTIKPGTTDLLTAIYICRNLDFSNILPNTRLPIYCIVSNKTHNLYVRYIGTETIQNRSGQSYHCYKFGVLLVDGSIFNGGEDMTVWVSDDKNRIPILIEAKIKVGSIKAYVNTIKGNRWPVVEPEQAKGN